MKSRVIPFEEFNIIILEVTKESPYSPTVYEYYIQESKFSDFHYVFSNMRKLYKPELRYMILDGQFRMGYSDEVFVKYLEDTGEKLNLDE